MSKGSKKTGTPKKKKRDAPKRKVLHSQTDLQPNKRKGFLRTSSSLRTLFLVALAAVVVAATLYALSPSISVSSLPALNRSDVLSTPLTILNDGFLTAHNVQARCFVIQAVDANGKEINVSSTADVKTEIIGDLHTKEPATLSCALTTA